MIHVCLSLRAGWCLKGNMCLQRRRDEEDARARRHLGRRRLVDLRLPLTRDLRLRSLAIDLTVHRWARLSRWAGKEKACARHSTVTSYLRVTSRLSKDQLRFSTAGDTPRGSSRTSAPVARRGSPESSCSRNLSGARSPCRMPHTHHHRVPDGTA